MINKRNIIIGSAVLGGISFIALCVYFFKKKKKQEDIYSTGEIDEVKNEAKPEPKTFPLGLGTEGKEVEQLQLYLLKKNGLQSKYDGVFDSTTESNVKSTFGVDQVTESLFREKRMSDFKTFKNQS